MSSVISQLKEVYPKDDYPDTYAALEDTQLLGGIPKVAGDAINHGKDLNQKYKEFQAEYVRLTPSGETKAPPMEFIPPDLLGGTADLGRGIYEKKGANFKDAVGEFHQKVLSARDVVNGHENLSDTDKSRLIGMLNEIGADENDGLVGKTNERVDKLEELLMLVETMAAKDRARNEAKTEGPSFQNYVDAATSYVSDIAFGTDYYKSAEDRAYEDALENAQKTEEERLKLFTTIIDPNENYLQHSFREQCYIQKNIYSLIKLRQGGNFPKKGRLPYVGNAGNSSVMCGGSPYGFMNKLTQPTTLMDFFDIPHDILSNLQPEVRLYKITMDADGNDVDEIEITFPGGSTTSDIKEAFKNKRRRGYGVGMKSFEWSMEGSDPFSAKRMISAKLTIHASNFTELLRDRTSEKGNKKFKYADLAIRTGTTKMQELTPAQCASQFSGISYDANYNLNFRLKVVVGYAIPKNLHVPAAQKRRYDKAIADCYATYDLSPTIHEFAFEDDGRVTFIINYQAYMQDYFDKPYFDVFSNGGNNMIKAYQIKMQRAFDAVTDGATTSGADPLPEKDDPNAIKKLKYDNLKLLLTRVFVKDRVYFYNIPYAELNRAVSSNSVAPLYDSDNKLKNEDQIREEIRNLENEAKNAIDIFVEADMKKRAKELQEEIDKSSDISSERNKGFNSSSHRQVAFFFFYDLIDTILEGIEDSIKTKEQVLQKMKTPGAAEQVKKRELKELKNASKNFARMRVLLGPMEIRDPRDPCKHMYISMGEIPISVKYFSEWMSSKMLAKDRVSYNFSTFIDQFIKNHISVFINDKTCGGTKATQPMAFHNTTLVSYSAAGEKMDDITAMLLYNNKEIKNKNKRTDYWVPTRGVLHALNTVGSRTEPLGPKNLGYKRQKNWLVYYAARTRPSEQMNGDREADKALGIGHYIVGQSSGIVKNIQLEKTPAPMLAEMRYVQEGYDGLLQLRQVYNANVDMYLLPNTYPGTVIFIDPRGFAPDTRGIKALNEDSEERKGKPVDKYELSRYGVGGYYLVFKAQHRIAEGERSTQLQSVWMHGHERKGSSSSDAKSKVNKNSEANKIQKCCKTKDNTYTSEAAPELSDDVQRPFYDMGEQVIGGDS